MKGQFVFHIYFVVVINMIYPSMNIVLISEMVFHISLDRWITRSLMYVSLFTHL